MFIKSVLQAIPFYSMSCFLLPKVLRTEMENLLSRYWWQQKPGKRGLHWCGWKALCALKVDGGLGFRCLSKFNITLLAKQGWRLLFYPNSLLARVLKSKYYPTTDFLHARLGNSPSYTRQSVWATRGLLQEGLYWKVGTRASISVTQDAWVPTGINYKIQDGVSDYTIQKAADLIDPITRQWDQDRIFTYLSSEDVARILNIPLSAHPSEDLLAWRGEASGLYTVRSGYKLLIQHNTLQLNSFPDSNFYRKMWMIPLPPKTKITMWRIPNNYLPTFCNLKCRRIMSTSSCPRCAGGTETITHALCDCPVSTEVWTLLRFSWPPDLDNSNQVEWISHIFSDYSLEYCRMFVCGLWALWTHRNKWVHERSVQTATSSATFVKTYLKELDEVGASLPLKNRPLCWWKAPRGATMKVNFDAAFCKNGFNSCSGILTRDNEGNAMASKYTCHSRIPSPFAAEAIACLDALMLCRDLGFPKLEIEGDSLTVIRKASSSDNDRSDIARILKILDKFQKDFMVVPSSILCEWQMKRQT